METHTPVLQPRSLGSILDETLAIYAGRFRFWITLVAVVQVPVSLVSLVLAQVWGGAAAEILIRLLSVVGAIYVYGAAVYAVGQHHVTGGVIIRDCYARAWWRAKTLSLLALLAFLALVALLLPLYYDDQPWVAVPALLLMPPAIAMAVYWSMAVQVIVVEGRMAIGSLRRSFALVRGSWWRVLGVALTFSLVGFGLAIVVTIPLAIISMVASADATAGVVTALVVLGQVIVGIVVPPVLFIAWTLLYYDMRVRKEEYDVAALSRELGIAAT